MMKKLYIGLACMLQIGLLMTSVPFVLAFNQMSAIGPASELDPIPENEIFAMYEKFDRQYLKRQQGNNISGGKWEELGREIDRYYGKLRFLFTSAGNGHIMLRLFLLEGESYLFASMKYFEEGNPKYLDLYEEGIRKLEWVIRRAEEEIDYLPNYSAMDTGLRLHPFAGYESIGTGFQKGFNGREVTWAIQYYASINQYLAFLTGRHGTIRQISSSQTARNLLSAFCPWGVEIYFLLKQAGLVNALDFRILRPFSGYTPTLMEKMIAGLKQFPDLIMGRPVDSRDEMPPPVISEVVLRPPQIPKHIHDEMHLIIGDGGKGFLDTLKKRPIKWAWVEKEPTYTVWYVSPTVFDWQPSDYLWLWFTALRMYFNPGDVIVDEVLAGILKVIGTVYGEQSNIYFNANIAVEANDKGFLTTEFIEKREWLSSASVTRKAAGFAFKAAEEQMRKDLYDGIDPGRFSLGTTYNGGAIPPIMIRADVCGYEQVPDDEYPRALHAVRFYLLSPGNIAHKGPYQAYDLSDASLGGMSALHREAGYLAEQNRFRPDGGVREIVRKFAWDKLPDPLNSFEVMTDFSPKKQRLEFRLSKAASHEDQVYAELWTIDPENAERYVYVPLVRGQQIFSFDLINKNDPEAEAEFEGRPVGRRGGSRAGEDSIQSSLQEVEARQGGGKIIFIGLVDVKNQYQLRLVAGGKSISAPYKVILDKGRKAQREITGRISSPETGTLLLNYSPEIEIVKLGVKAIGLDPGKPAPGNKP